MQPLILKPVFDEARALTFVLKPGRDGRRSFAKAVASLGPANTVLGVGVPLVSALGGEVEGLGAFPSITFKGGAFPSTQGALWIQLQGSGRGEIAERARSLKALLDADFLVSDDTEMFVHTGHRDLSGYEDGTENPKGAAMKAAAIRADGWSFVAVQKWVHDLAAFKARTQKQQDDVIGRRLSDNEELAKAPKSAHVKRTAQESFEPPAFMVRRSMPFTGPEAEGLYFIAYVAALDAFERMLRRMAGEEDGVVDAITTMSRAVSGGYYVCPPVKGGRFEVAAIGG